MCPCNHQAGGGQLQPSISRGQSKHGVKLTATYVITKARNQLGFSGAVACKMLNWNFLYQSHNKTEQCDLYNSSTSPPIVCKLSVAGKCIMLLTVPERARHYCCNNISHNYSTVIKLRYEMQSPHSLWESRRGRLSDCDKCVWPCWAPLRSPRQRSSQRVEELLRWEARWSHITHPLQ